MNCKVALIYPPTCDPTAPYLSLPTLTGWLRSHGVEVEPIDANLEAWTWLLRKAPLQQAAERIERRLRDLDRRRLLGHGEQLEYASLWQARGDARVVPGQIDEALNVMRDPRRFHDGPSYEGAVAAVQRAMDVLSAATGSLQVDFVRYRTPFALLDPAEIELDSAPQRNPFHAYYQLLAERLEASRVHLIGLSVAFPGQMLPAWTLARELKRRLPACHVTAGGPALTQALVRLRPEARSVALGPFDSAVLYEGEHALLQMVRQLERGQNPSAEARVLVGRQVDDLSTLPAPDFDGLPLDRYLAPSLVLPYDPTRGCYWGRCGFCHYGLADSGTARYRERDPGKVAEHLAMLSARHGCKVFYLSEDTLAPSMARRIAGALQQRRAGLRWATDMRPERGLTPELCGAMAESGALAVSLGVESGAPRVLQLIDKGVRLADMRAAIQALSGAGIAVEAMCMTGFPTESPAEARATLRMLGELHDSIALFIVGEFHLTHGSRVAAQPQRYGLAELWELAGDTLAASLFWRPSEAPADTESLERDLDRLSGRWLLRPYPWAGALSTAHTLLGYDRHGPGAFKRPRIELAEPRSTSIAPARFDVEQVTRDSSVHEAALWQQLTEQQRAVSRQRWEALARSLPAAQPSPGMWSFGPGLAPVRIVQERCVRPAGRAAPRRSRKARRVR